MPSQKEHQPEVEPVKIWRCRSKECSAWIRNEFVTTSEPECPLCKGPMIRGMKHLPKRAKKVRKKKTAAEEVLVH